MKKDNAIVYLSLGMMALYDGHDREAISFFKNALEAMPNMVEAHIALGLAYTRVGNQEEMVETFWRAIQINKVAIRKWAKSSIQTPHRWLSNRPEYAHIVGKMAEFLRKQDEADALARLAAADIGTGRNLSAVNALEYCLSLAPDYEAGIVLLVITYLLLKTEDKGKVASLIMKSIFKKTSPKLVKAILKN